MITIFDVAKEAGVSVATVSRVMNNSNVVAESTARAVREAIARLDYVPNLHARNLRRNESGTVLVLLPNITNPYYANVFSGINEKAQELGYHLFLCNTEGGDPEALLSNAINGKRADGAILLAIDFDEEWIEQYGGSFPLVQCCEYAETCPTAHVSIDNYRAAYEATEYLLKLGHRKIGIISSTNRFISTRERMQGYLDALLDANIAPDEGNIGYTDEKYGYFKSLRTAKTLLSRPDRPDALFCISDSIALSAVIAAGELGISVPGDISVVGFDDVLYTKMLHPYLTTVVQPCAELGSRAIEMLHSIIAGGALDSPGVILPHGFIVRESTAALPALQTIQVPVLGPESPSK